MNPLDVQILCADLQPEIVARSKMAAPKTIATAAAVLANVATVLGLPILLSIVTAGGTEPSRIPELAGYARRLAFGLKHPVIASRLRHGNPVPHGPIFVHAALVVRS